MQPCFLEAHKLCEGDVQDDRFSSLPESLIHHIFSFLDGSDVACVCVQSRNCRQACLSNPYLSFVLHKNKRTYSSRCRNFSSFLNRLMSDRGENDIVHFKLHWNSDCDYDYDYDNEKLRLDAWIRKASESNIAELNLNIKNRRKEGLFTMDSLLSSKFLRVLELDLHNSVLELPPTVLGSLQVMSLKSVSPQGNLSLSEWTSACCPSLKKLNLSSVSGLKFFENHHIEELSIKENYCDPCFSILCDNLVSLYLHLRRRDTYDDNHISVKIYTPKLEVLEWRGVLVDGVDLGTFTLLSHATIDLTYEPHYRRRTDKSSLGSYIKILKRVVSAKVLCLNFFMIEVLFNSQNEALLFENLHELTIILNCWEDYLVLLIVTFASKFPLLTTLTIEPAPGTNYGPSNWDNEAKGFFKSKAKRFRKEMIETRHSLFSLLKQVRIQLVDRNDQYNGIKLVKYFLKTVDCLEEMTIFYPYFSSSFVDLQSPLYAENFPIASSQVNIVSLMKKLKEKREE